MELTGLKIGLDTPRKDSYVWEAPGRNVSIHLDYDVVDRLGAEILRGYAAVPRRGLEVGGILLGTADWRGRLVARIEDFEPVPSRYVNGPAYELGEEEQLSFQSALERWAAAPGRRVRAIGFYRGHTREGLGLTPADVELLNRFFPEETAVVLLVKPYATRPPAGAFFFREGDNLRTEDSYQEFPFRRQELGGGQAPEAGRGTGEEQNMRIAVDSAADGLSMDNGKSNSPAQDRQDESGTSSEDLGDPHRSLVPGRSLKLRGGWVWIPLSFIFLLLGTVLGFQVAMSVQAKLERGPAIDPYALDLSATPSADSIHVRWDRMAPAILKAQRAVLTIREGDKEQAVSLDAAHLRNGSVIYRRAAGDVQFRLEVFTKQKVSVSEIVDFHSPPSGE